MTALMWRLPLHACTRGRYGFLQGAKAGWHWACAVQVRASTWWLRCFGKQSGIEDTHLHLKDLA